LFVYSDLEKDDEIKDQNEINIEDDSLLNSDNKENILDKTLEENLKIINILENNLIKDKKKSNEDFIYVNMENREEIGNLIYDKIFSKV